jgi:hypothetical protein
MTYPWESPLEVKILESTYPDDIIDKELLQNILEKNRHNKNSNDGTYSNKSTMFTRTESIINDAKDYLMNAHSHNVFLHIENNNNVDNENNNGDYDIIENVVKEVEELHINIEGPEKNKEIVEYDYASCIKCRNHIFDKKDTEIHEESKFLLFLLLFYLYNLFI